MSKASFEMIEQAFDLHPITAQALILRDGAVFSHLDKDPGTRANRRLQVVIKAQQKAEVGNYLLSMSYDFATGRTYALICGAGVVMNRGIYLAHGNHFEQICTAIREAYQLWTHPLLLPSVIFQNYTYRMHLSREATNIEITRIEDLLGVTYAGGAGRTTLDENWPRNIKTKEMSIRLHSLTTQVSYRLGCCKWLQECSRFLSDLRKRVRMDEDRLELRTGADELEETLAFVQSQVQLIENFFVTAKERTSMQMNLLFNIIEQQDSIINQRDSALNVLIARSTKKDGISMMTFTFIAALFLPGTFVATLFSMTMFDWQPDDNNGGSGTGNGTSYVSNKFWIFWAVAAPLTVLTMGGWWVWFQLASRKWLDDLNVALDTVRRASNPDQAAYFGNPLAYLDENKKGGAASGAGGEGIGSTDRQSSGTELSQIQTQIRKIRPTWSWAKTGTETRTRKNRRGQDLDVNMNMDEDGDMDLD